MRRTTKMFALTAWLVITGRAVHCEPTWESLQMPKDKIGQFAYVLKISGE